jgi:hypothetical protein
MRTTGIPSQSHRAELDGAQVWPRDGVASSIRRRILVLLSDESVSWRRRRVRARNDLDADGRRTLVILAMHHGFAMLPKKALRDKATVVSGRSPVRAARCGRRGRADDPGNLVEHRCLVHAPS